MSDNWTSRLSEYLDGELDAKERVALEVHLDGCGECTLVLRQLRSVVARAEELDDRPPSNYLWPEIARRIKTGTEPEVAVPDLAAQRSRNRRRLSLTVPQLMAAGIALILLSSGAVWFSLSGGRPTSRVVAGTDLKSGMAVAVLTGFGQQEYDQAVAELREVLEGATDRLDTATVRVLEQSLAAVDRAIAEARAAIDADPESEFLSTYLADAMKRKVQLLKRAASIVAAS
ncbi:MAG: zf-HC2 domain-containing protein [Gemmatimonadales bacterium]